MQNEWIKQLLFNKTHSQTVMVKGFSRGPTPDQPGILQSTEYKGYSYSLMFPFTYINDSYILCYQLKSNYFTIIIILITIFFIQLSIIILTIHFTPAGLKSFLIHASYINVN